MVPIGLRGEKRLSDAIAQAVLIGRIATGAAEEEYVDADKRHAGLKGGRSRAESVAVDTLLPRRHTAASLRSGRGTCRRSMPST